MPTTIRARERGSRKTLNEICDINIYTLSTKSNWIEFNICDQIESSCLVFPPLLLWCPHPLILQQPSATLHIKHLCWSHQKIMLSCDIYDTGEGSVSVYLVWDTWQCINGHHWQTPANTTTHTHSGDKKYKADKWTETVTRSKYSFAAGWDGDCVLNYILSCIKPVTFGWVPAVSPDGPHPISRLTSAQQFKHPPFIIILYNFLHKTPHNGPWWSMCADERSGALVTNVYDVVTIPARFVGC